MIIIKVSRGNNVFKVRKTSQVQKIVHQGRRGLIGPQGPIGPEGPQGEAGEAGNGIPSGGTLGQYLRKSSSTDYDTNWANIASDEISVSGQTNKFVTAAQITLINSAIQPGDNISDLLNDAGYLAAGDNISDLVNDSGFVSNLSTFDTGDLAEGSNLYYTNERVDDRVAALLQEGSGITLTYDDVAGTLTIASTGGSGAWGGITGTLSDQTDLQSALDAKYDASNPNNYIANISGFDTDDLGEGAANLYFTNERAQDAVGSILTDSSEIDFTYNDGANTISAAIVAGSIDESKLDASVNASLDLADSALQASDIGSTVQAYDADLATWAGLTPSANAQSLVTAADYAAMRALLDLEAGTDFYSISAANAAFQPLNAALTSISGLTTLADRMIYTTASNTYAVATLTSAARTILDDSSTSAIRTTLGVGTGDSPQFTAVNIGHASDTTLARLSAGNLTVEGNLIYRAGGTDVPVTDGGTGASDASGARTNLGLVIGTNVQAYDAELAALAGLTSAANKIPMFSGSGTATLLDFKDEDDMVSDSATAVPSQQSVKAYVDANIGGGGSPDWGDIGGTLADQTDLQTALDAKANLEGGVVFNEAGGDFDFRVEGDNDTHLLYADGGIGFVGVNKSSHDGWAKFIVAGGSRFEDDFRFGKGSGTQYVTRFPTGTSGYNLEFQVRSACITMYGAGGIVFNEDGIAENDVRIEGDTMTGLFATDAGIDGLGFYNATPVAQQVLATGAGATVDNVISLLQTLGLCKQS